MTPSDSTSTGWLEISLEADAALHDALSSFLFDIGCTGVVTEDFGDAALTAYLPFRQNLDNVRNRMDRYLQELKEIFPHIPCPVATFSKIDNQDWGLSWRRFFHPARATSDLLILPAWESMPKTDAAHTILMDPGPAFGTGQHATTRMCLEAMEKHRPKGSWSMLDVGTGSGILAIYGAKLGARPVMAIDTDPEALRWAERNLKLNHVTESIQLSKKPLEEFQETFLVICANLMLSEILRLMPSLSQRLAVRGRLILSGILEEQGQKVIESLHSNGPGLMPFETLHAGEWVCITAQKGSL